MISNLRARPIEGYVTDSAGNIIRNSSIVIYRNSPTGLIAVDRVTSDDEGYFISSPLPNGVFDIFESGIRTSRIIHGPDMSSIQCFKASKDNYFETDIIPFSTLADADPPTLNQYKYFLQIEPEDISVDVYGNRFPIYDVDLSVVNSNVTDFYSMKNFLNLRPDSRITISRFDVEYFLPITATQSTYRRIKWAGVPGIRFKTDSKLVVPLDYFSIVANSPFIRSNNGGDFSASQVQVESPTATTLVVSGDSDVSGYSTFYNKVGIGDIVRLTTATKTWYGIVTLKNSFEITLEKWKSSRYPNVGSPVAGNDILTLQGFHGIFQGMSSMSSSVSDYFTVVENFYQQNVETELYNYGGA